MVAGIFLFTTACRPGLGPTQSYPMGNRASLPKGRVARV